ncbi:MAG: hypothetical protein OXG24_07460 [Gammaproteobacteria bacterium]|nr:hypothetical protein [Gammaproteobacteria bacterium]
MKLKNVAFRAFLAFILVLLVSIQVSPQIFEKTPDEAVAATVEEVEDFERTTMEEMVVSEVREQIENAFTYNDFHTVKDRAEYYYRIGRYKDAFPYLLASAKRGFKIAQAQVGYIYLTGQGVVKPSKATAIAWLGVAASPRSDPEIKNYYKDLMKTIPEELKPKVEELVQSFIDTYGPKATGMSCIHVRRAGTHVSDLKCNFKGEFEHRDAMFQDWLSTGFDAVSPYTTGPGEGADSLSAPSGSSGPASGGG